ncbi:TonB-dependent receptor plug domain-containing protein [Pseudaquabacterium pictum]|uniref:Ligand-gated channel n=1 Tax=Pseudaquabacterium pictum TaxID=2315236 RepID=A0A480AJN3_9BURK|nr:TonB-dependent receptor [Rubrivivax pictus]GCL61844.1 ligand-gated channel [Rubrivivax pictus]
MPATPAGQTVVIEGRGDDAASRRQQAIGATTVIGREALDEAGDQSLLDVLQRVPGIGIDGDAPRLLGMGAGYTQILLNGEPAPPGFSLEQLAPGDIERIEIVKGPTAEFGGAAGTINVILRSPPKLRQRELRGAVGWRTVRPQGTLAGHWGDRFGDVGLFLPVSLYSWANGADLEVQRSSTPAGGTLSRQRVTGRDQWLGGGLNLAPRLEWKASDTDTWQAQLFLQRNHHHNRGWRSTEALDGPAPTLASDASRSDGSWQLLRSQLQWLRKQPDGSRLELKATAEAARWTNAGSAQGLTPQGSPGSLRETSALHRDRKALLGARWRLPLGEAHTLNSGVDVQQRARRELNRRFIDGSEQITSATGVPLAVDIDHAVAFVQDEWAVSDRATLLAGLRAEQHRLWLQGAGAAVRNQWQLLSPNLQFRQALDGRGRDVLRLSLARSQRTPDVGLLLPRYNLNGSYEATETNTPIAVDTAGNPQLQPERLLTADLRLERTLDGGGVLSAGLSHRRVQDLIRRRITLETVAEASAPRWVSRPVNLSSARSSALDLELKGSAPQLLGALWAQAPKALQLRAAVSWFRSSVEQIDDPDARLDGQPPWQTTLGADWQGPVPGFSAGATWTYTPGFRTRQTDNQRVWRGSSSRLDAHLQWRIDRQRSLRLAVNNALAPDSLSSNAITGSDGSLAASSTRRGTVPQFTAGLQWRL